MTSPTTADAEVADDATGSRRSGLVGRHVVITGGAGALGGAVVDAFIAAGAICHVPVRRLEGPVPSPPPPRMGAAAPGRVELVAGVDLTDEAAVTAFYASRPDALWASVHLAGGFAMGGITETSLAELRSQLEMNVVTTFLCCREAVRRFRARPGGGGGRLVNVASRAAFQPGARVAAYSMSKAAVVSLTTSLAEELKHEHILVNAVAPGTIDTPANRRAMPSVDVATLVAPAAIASAILWLSSPDNRIASGGIIPVYGTS